MNQKIFADVTRRLNRAGLRMHGGTVVDAALVEAQSSTKNETGDRDPKMYQTKKGNQWHFGMKVHAGVDAGTGYVHTITVTAANVHDSAETPKLIRPDDTVVYGDSGYLGVQKLEAVQNDEHLSQIDLRVNKRPSSLKTHKKFAGINWKRMIEHRKSLIRSKVEHVFLIVKRDFGYRKTVYRGLAKNMHRFHFLFGLANLLMCVRAGQKQRFGEG